MPLFAIDLLDVRMNDEVELGSLATGLNDSR
jgi:hypothetical protein